LFDGRRADVEHGVDILWNGGDFGAELLFYTVQVMSILVLERQRAPIEEGGGSLR
jgi:hypothetical protein